MSELKRILKSIGAAVLALASGCMLVGGIAYVMVKLSDKAVLILLVSLVALGGISVLSAMFYESFKPESPARPETK